MIFSLPIQWCCCEPCAGNDLHRHHGLVPSEGGRHLLLTFELFVFMSVHICLSVRGEIRGQLPQVSSLLPPCGIQGRDSGCQVCASTLHQPSHLLSQGRRMQPLCPGLSGLTWSGATVSLCSVLRGLLRQPVFPVGVGSEGRADPWLSVSLFLLL